MEIDQPKVQLGDIPPNHTVYANNLDDHIKKQELRTQLYCLFAQYGVILDVVALKTPKMRGQAFVTFRDVASATQALHSLQGFSFFGKPLRLQYAKCKANVVAQMEGTFDPRSRPKRKVEFGVAPGGGKKAVGTGAQEVVARADEPSRSAPAALGASARAEADGAAAAAAAAAAATAEPPNKILFVQNLPDVVNEQMLRLLFQQFESFCEVRLVPGQAGIAFVEFGDDAKAGVAMKALQAFKVTPTHTMKISFAKA
ncbi:hypothetical protein KFE25_000024 [Diacronema lutheri]|uniref:RRM domain-containing protein n=1 Tax=Diacronema lutheri TaxID=2081491 RepID=A0A8J5X8X7_DIALT|nr:hypothetical protein KFE25_000024 [Diacronema lutheri]